MTTGTERQERKASGHHGVNLKSGLDVSDTFQGRHIGPRCHEIAAMLGTLGLDSLDALVKAAVPEAIRLKRPLKIGDAGQSRGEAQVLAELKQIAGQNQVLRSCIGMGYYDCITPPVIQRNILENPAWYTPYTPYQSEISQGRLEALLNFQTMVEDLTGLPLANASLLDEATAAAEAMAMCRAIAGESPRDSFYVAEDCHPQTIAVIKTRAMGMGIKVVVARAADMDFSAGEFFGLLLQYPATDGTLADHSELIARAKGAGVVTAMATDLLALTLLKPPGEFGADIAVGSSQRFGVPMAFGGPHAAFMATRTEYARKMPGRIVGVSRDAAGNVAFRLAIQTREQHIRREKATSNICTAQALLAVMAGMYACYHGPRGLKRIAERVRLLTNALAMAIRRFGHDVAEQAVFDTIRVRPSGLPCESILSAARSRGFNLRKFPDESIGISLDETTTEGEVEAILESFAGGATFRVRVDQLAAQAPPLPENLARAGAILQHPVFNSHHSETEMLRHIFRLAGRDISLAQSMIPLGSCTMKLNATSEMLPVTWPEFARLHPFAPAEQARGYAVLISQLESWLAEIAGLPAVSLQPNAGSQGEFAGLTAIRAYLSSRGESKRNVCLIPVSAHGTNPATAVIAGMKVVAVACDESGDVQLSDLEEKARNHAGDLACIMLTYPSTHGVFEAAVKEICALVHEHGGLVYMDGANMNAQVGICRPGDLGADVCHFNLHKTFCIPHGGGGPGVGPIAVTAALAPFLPGRNGLQVAAAPFGSAGILPISWVYIALMGGEGLLRATQVAILNANYMARRLEGHYPILFKGPGGWVAHEFVIDCRGFEASAGIKVDDIAKRLMDYGFHAPTMSWPVPGTLMVEPTESESKQELDRFCDAMISIGAEIAAIEKGQADRTDNLLRNAPHTAEAVAADEWKHPYSRQQAAWPVASLHSGKFWPPVGRVDNPFGDRNLVCACPPMER